MKDETKILPPFWTEEGNLLRHVSLRLRKAENRIGVDIYAVIGLDDLLLLARVAALFQPCCAR